MAVGDGRAVHCNRRRDQPPNNRRRTPSLPHQLSRPIESHRWSTPTPTPTPHPTPLPSLSTPSLSLLAYHTEDVALARLSSLLTAV